MNEEDNQLIPSQDDIFIDLPTYISELYVANDLIPLREYSNPFVDYSIYRNGTNLTQEEEPQNYVLDFNIRPFPTDITGLIPLNDSIGFSNHPKVCKGCRNYYGRKDGEHVIICAIHPYGVETDNCIDYSS